MTQMLLTNVRYGATSEAMRMLATLTILLSVAGCVTIKAPDKPIEINLNVNIKQEVILSLKQDASDLIKNNEDLFPK
jgi:YnbE-like lipoprotein